MSFVCAGGGNDWPFCLLCASPGNQIPRGGLRCVDQLDTGTPAGVSTGYDCAVREHAWEFAKATLPRRGQFKSAFDALQLWRCNTSTPAPTHDDHYVAPTLAPPTDGAALIFADAGAASGGNGSKTHPFPTLEAGLAAAEAALATGFSKATLVLRGGRYFTHGIVLTPRHSGLTIQSYNGEDVALTGSVKVPAPKHAWSLHDELTNTWSLDLSDWREMPSQVFGMRVGTESAVRARWPNGNPETGTGYSLGKLQIFARKPPNETPIQNFFSNPEDWPGVYWLSQPEGGDLPNAGENLAGTGHWEDAYGGPCSGRQAPFGYWCSAQNSRAAATNDYYPPYGMPGGFDFKLGLANASEPHGAPLDAAGRAATWRHPVGAIYHIAEAFASIQCLVSGVTINATDGHRSGAVHFDPTIGCDQVAVSPLGWQSGLGGNTWYVENVQGESRSPVLCARAPAHAMAGGTYPLCHARFGRTRSTP